MPDISADRENYRILSWDVAPGDAIAFNFRTVHGAPANHTAERRAAIAFRWLGDDVAINFSIFCPILPFRIIIELNCRHHIIEKHPIQYSRKC